MKKLFLVGLVLLSHWLTAYSAPRVPSQGVNSRSMLPARCLAGTRLPDKKAPGGFAASANMPRPLGTMQVREPNIYLQANPNQASKLSLGSRTPGSMTLLLVNPTSSTKAFSASDSCLSIVQEARDMHGRWKPIEFFYTSTCGNSYHRVFLGPREYWSFAVPRYQGSYRTQLRFRLSEGDVTWLSNEFSGSINPGQFIAPKDPYKQVLAPLSNGQGASRAQKPNR